MSHLHKKNQGFIKNYYTPEYAILLLYFQRIESYPKKMLSHLEISVAVSLVPVAKKGRLWHKSPSLLADPNSPQRSIYGKGMKSFPYTPKVQVYVPLIRLRADKANLIKHAFGIGRAKRRPMWRLMREEGEILKEEDGLVFWK